MKRGHYVLAAGLGAAALAGAAYLLRRNGMGSPAMAPADRGVTMIDGAGGDPLPAATGREWADNNDPLGGPIHALTDSEARNVRYRAKAAEGGKATSREREGMYHDPSGAGEAGSMSDRNGREDQAPIGRIK